MDITPSRRKLGIILENRLTEKLKLSKKYQPKNYFPKLTHIPTYLDENQSYIERFGGFLSDMFF